MKRWLFTLPILLAGMVGLVRADYFLIVLNTAPQDVKSSKDTTTATKDNKDIKPLELVSVIVETNRVLPMTKIDKDTLDKTIRPIEVKYGHYPNNIALSAVPLRPFLYLIELYTYSLPGDKATAFHVHNNPARQFEAKLADDKKMPSLELAEWALTHGLLDKFVETMDKLTADEKTAPELAAVLKNYRQIKEKLNANLPDPNPKPDWFRRFEQNGIGYHFLPGKEHDHYLIIHNAEKKDMPDVESRRERLEETFKTFFYWHALHGKVLPLPREKLPVIVVAREVEKNVDEEFRAVTDGGKDRLKNRAEDGFYARREGILYLNLTSREPSFEKASVSVAKMLDPYRKSVDEWLKTPHGTGQPAFPWVLALTVKALEADAERATVSHYGTRQLVYATGMLPRYVVAPEWIQFGLASFFETPLGSPWTNVAGLSTLHLQPCLAALSKKDADSAEVIKEVVRDGCFHKAALTTDKESETALQEGRALSWGLTYYMIHRKPDQLKAYAEELNRMPRDLMLDEEVLLECFARAVGAVDANRKVDTKKLRDLADDCKTYLEEKSHSAEAKEPAELVAKLKANLNFVKSKLGPPPMPPNP